MSPKKILFANVPADGHFNPLTSLAVHLKESGHDVRWYTGAKYQGKIEGLGIPFYPIKRAIDFSLDDFREIFPERDRFKTQIPKLKFDIRHAFVLRGPEYYEDIREIELSFPFDLLISDNCFTGLPFVKQLLEKPAIAIGVVPLSETSKDLPPSGLGLTPSSTFIGKRIQDVMRFFTDKFIFGESKRLINEIYKNYGMETREGNVFDVIGREADFLLQSGTPGFEYQRSDLGKNVRFVGPLLPHSRKKGGRYELPSPYKAFRNKILVTQGTIETNVEKLIVPTLEAFKNSDILVIATTGGVQTAELRTRFPYANILIEDFIPFNDIMPECDVYITNGGYGGVLLGIQNKLPMVVAGVHEGKNEINARVGYFKLGINLKTERPAASQIRVNVDIVLRNSLYRKNVVRLAKEFNRYNPSLLAEKYVDEILGRKERGIKATFLKMMEKYIEEKVY